MTRIQHERRAVPSASQALGIAKMAGPPPAWPAPHDVVTVSIAVPEPLVIGDALLTLRIGSQTFKLGQAISAPGQGHKAASFILTPEAFAALPQGAAVVLENGAQRFDLGPLDKSLLR